MKNGIKITLIILGIIILFSLMFFLIDYTRVQNKEKPIFCIHVGTYSDGGTKEYYGLGYKVIAFNKILELNQNTSTLEYYTSIKIGTWFMAYNDFEEEYSKKINELDYYKDKLEQLPKEFLVEEAVNRGYFVYDGYSNKIYNKNVLDKFVENTKIDAINREKDELTIVIYSVNKEPSIYNIVYNENGYILVTDNSRIHTVEEELPREYYKININNNIPKEYYGITIKVEEGINATVISLTSYNKDRYEDIEIARYLSNSEIISKE